MTKNSFLVNFIICDSNYKGGLISHILMIADGSQTATLTSGSPKSRGQIFQLDK